MVAQKLFRESNQNQNDSKPFFYYLKELISGHSFFDCEIFSQIRGPNDLGSLFVFKYL